MTTLATPSNASTVAHDPTMPEPGRPVMLRLFTDGEATALIRTTPIEVSGVRMRLRGDTPVEALPGQRLELMYRDGRQRFVSARARLIKLETDGRQPILFVERIGGAEDAEKRGAFRVFVGHAPLRVLLPDHRPLQPLDISGEGLAVLLTHDPLPGSHVEIELASPQQRAHGRVQVRDVRRRDDGRFRVGLWAPRDQVALREMLLTWTMHLQRQQLRRMSRLDGAPGAPAATPAATPAEPVDSEAHETAPEAPADDHNDAVDLDGQTLTFRVPMSRLVGRALPVCLLDESGRPVLEAGTVLTGEQLATLGELSLYVDESWLDRAAAAAPTTSRRRDLRRFPRHPWHTALQVQLCDEHDRRRLSVRSCDLSRGGFSFLTNRYIAAGTPLIAEIRTPAGVYRLRGTVRHCRLHHAPDHWVGVQFTQCLHDPSIAHPQ